MKRKHWSVVDLAARQGSEIGVSEWIVVDQSLIDAFAKVTLDAQYIHVDPERASETPFGGTIAHGFLILSLLSAMLFSGTPAIEGETAGINYGFEKIRFLAPVRSGSRVRGRFQLISMEEKCAGQWLVTLGAAIEVENETKPALVAQWITMSLL